MTTPKEVFETALALKEGEEIKISFKTAKRLDSFRVSLYREKARVNDETILIAKKSGALYLKKGAKEEWDDEISVIVRKEQKQEETDEENSCNFPLEEEGEEEPQFLVGIPDDIKASYKTFSGAGIRRIKSLLSTVMAAEFQEFEARVKEGKELLSLTDYATKEEKEEAYFEFLDNERKERSALEAKRRKILDERS